MICLHMKDARLLMRLKKKSSNKENT